MAELTPRDNVKKQVSEILKKVDRLLKSGEMDQAMREIVRAKQLDPKNVYIYAYEERLSFLRSAHVKNIDQEKTREEAQEGARRSDEERKKALEEQHRVEEEAAKKNAEEKRRAEEDRKRQEREQQQNEEEQQRHQDLQKHIPELELDHQSALAEYKQALALAWEDGSSTTREDVLLVELRQLLHISIEEHARLEKEIKIEIYRKEIRDAWSAGSVTPQGEKRLAAFREQLNITPQEHVGMEAQYLWEVRAAQEKPKIVFIDDDDKFLEIMSQIIREAGFDVEPFTTTDEAYTYLKTATPDMIVSDINLETSTMGGFSFFEKVREIERLVDVPFIFLSGLTDDVLIRTGKELGVDEYLTKPISDDTFLATIRGKIKRYKQMKKMREKKQ
ncbi:MAG: response regulator [bacterium]